jgi:hypothetical protein
MVGSCGACNAAMSGRTPRILTFEAFHQNMAKGYHKVFVAGKEGPGHMFRLYSNVRAIHF